MRAIVHDRYGPPDVLRLDDVPVPIPGADEVLIRVHVATVNRTDCGFRAGRPYITRFFSGFRTPKFRVLGSEFAGVVTAVGSHVTRFAVGDRVFGVNAAVYGAHAEFMVVGQTDPIARIPDSLTFEQAAALSDGAILALTCLRRAGVGPGTNLLIHGASGAIGSAGVQLAVHLGAEVVAVCNTRNVDVVRSLGPVRVVDFETEDFTAIGERFDVVFDAVGKSSFRRCRRLVRPGGWYISTDLGFLSHVPFLALASRLTAPFGWRRISLPIPTYRQAEVELVVELAAAGAFQAVIDRTYPLEATADAYRYVETEQKTGNVLISVASGD